jgi:NAD(P)-dependent dehydrogenase (short-subunit alcohol dehydrogenase family)
MTSVKLNGKVIIVTGSTQGLGEGIACYLAQLGATSIVLCGRNQEKGEKVRRTLEELNLSSIFIPADLTKESDCRFLVTECDRHFGRVDGLVNAAGLSNRGYLEDTTVEMWNLLFAVNVRAPFILTQEVVRIMKREKIAGSIVNIITISSYGGQPYLTAYCSSKGALATFTKNVAHALRRDRIRVNGLNIGWMDTPNEHIVQKAMGKPDNWLELAEAKQPFGRLLKPLDVAKLTAYLLSDDSQMMTGSIIDYDQNVIGSYD